MKDYPVVSVVISTYDRPERLDKALESVHAQTFKDFEVIVVDDCSPNEESNHAVMQKWHDKLAERGVTLHAFKTDENSGYQCVPKNYGVSMAHGDYIAYLDDDNTWRPDHIEVLVAAIESDFSTDMVYSRLCYHVDGDDELKDLLKANFGGELPVGDMPGQPWIPQLLEQRNYIDTSTILHSRGAFYRLVKMSGMGWDERVRRMGDWNFVWRWATFGLTAKLVDKVTLDYNWHKGSMQVSRPMMETPVCSSYSEWQRIKKTLPSMSQSA